MGESAPSREAAAAAVLAMLNRCLVAAPGDAESALSRLTGIARRLLSRPSWASVLMAPMLGTLAKDPWHEPALRASRDRARTGLVLFANNHATIAATVTAPDAALDVARTVVAPGRVTVSRFVAPNGGVLRRWWAGLVHEDFVAADMPACHALPDRHIANGSIITLDGRCQGWLVDAGEGPISSLSITLNAGAMPYMREYALPEDGGRLARATPLDDQPSRRQMLLTMLRLLGRADAGPAFAAATCAGPPALRWAAMREWLALDAVTAMPRLATMAEDPHPEVAEMAQQTLRQLARLRMEAA